MTSIKAHETVMEEKTFKAEKMHIMRKKRSQNHLDQRQTKLKQQ